MARQTHIHATSGAAGRLRDPRPGHLEVLRVLRARPRVRGMDRAALLRNGGPARLQLEGAPGSPGSIVRRAELVFLSGLAVPLPELDRGRRLIRLYYPMEEFHHVVDVLAQRAQHFFYLWRPGDGGCALAMLVASR